jgi:hypothetical protein
MKAFIWSLVALVAITLAASTVLQLVPQSVSDAVSQRLNVRL